MSRPFPKISIVTPSYNNEKTIADTLSSVANQDYPNIEHLIIDGLSSDKTAGIVARYSHVSKFVSEKDSGLYEAINKGIKLSSGDYIGILNTDDVLADNTIITQLVNTIRQAKVEAIYGDVAYYTSDLRKSIRYYSSEQFHPSKFKTGHMPAHPSFYTTKECFEKYGYYKEDYQIAADFELLVRHLYKNKVRHQYTKLCMVKMRAGGMSNSSLKNRLIVNKEMVRACKENGINTNLLQMSRKIIYKLSEYLSVDKKHV